MYPRVRVFLNEDEVQLSALCTEHLRQLRERPDFAALQRFHKLFGHVFVTSVLLGGQQRTTKFAGESTNQEIAKVQDRVRSAVGLKITAPYVSAGIQHSTEKSLGTDSSSSAAANLSNVVLSAIGGNTLVGSDIPQWAPTVAAHQNWRVIKNETVVPIHQLIGSFSAWSDIPELFANIFSNRDIYTRPWRGRFSLWFKSKPLCWHNTEKCLVLRSGDLQQGNRAIFGLEDADVSRLKESPSKIEPRADWPMFLTNALDSNGPAARLENSEGIASILCLGTSQNHKISRYSFRQADTRGQWQPHPANPKTIGSGDHINLYCHSLSRGPFADVAHPPKIATPAEIGSIRRPSLRYKGVSQSDTDADDEDIQALVFASFSDSPDRVDFAAIVQSYDAGTMTEVERRMFEIYGLSQHIYVQRVMDTLESIKARIAQHKVTNKPASGTADFLSAFWHNAKSLVDAMDVILLNPDRNSLMVVDSRTDFLGQLEQLVQNSDPKQWTQRFRTGLDQLERRLLRTVENWPS